MRSIYIVTVSSLYKSTLHVKKESKWTCRKNSLRSIMASDSSVVCDNLMLASDCNSLLNDVSLRVTMEGPSRFHIARLSPVLSPRIGNDNSFLGHRTQIGCADTTACRPGWRDNATNAEQTASMIDFRPHTSSTLYVWWEKLEAYTCTQARWEIRSWTRPGLRNSFLQRQSRWSQPAGMRDGWCHPLRKNIRPWGPQIDVMLKPRSSYQQSGMQVKISEIKSAISMGGHFTKHHRSWPVCRVAIWISSTRNACFRIRAW